MRKEDTKVWVTPRRGHPHTASSGCMGVTAPGCPAQGRHRSPAAADMEHKIITTSPHLSFPSLTFLPRANASFWVQWAASLDTKTSISLYLFFSPSILLLPFRSEETNPPLPGHLRAFEMTTAMIFFQSGSLIDRSIIRRALILNTSTVQTVGRGSTGLFCSQLPCTSGIPLRDSPAVALEQRGWDVQTRVSTGGGGGSPPSSAATLTLPS